jgi:PBSX family phage terminase large subunit
MPEWEFRGDNLAMRDDRSREAIIAGPSETGKTLACLYKLNSIARQFPNARGAIVRKVRADMDSTVLDLFNRSFIRPAGDVTVFGGERPEHYRYPNGTTVYVGGIDRPGKVLSGALDFVYVNQAEELDLGDWEILSTRTTGRAGVIVPGLLFGDCNPAQSNHWILSRGLRLYHSRHEDNPSLYTDDGTITEQGQLTLSVLDGLSGIRHKRLRLGQWANVEGAVYDGFDKAIHVIDRFEIPQEWRRIRAIDFGYTNPFWCGWFAVDHDGRMYLYREIYQTRRTVKVHAKQINELSADENIEATVADWDAEDRATLEENGIYPMAAEKMISPGIQAVQERLTMQGDGKARLYIFRDALVERDESLAARHLPVCLADELEVYAWPKGADGRAVKEVPVDVHNHGCDGLRYATMYLKQPTSIFAWGG